MLNSIASPWAKGCAVLTVLAAFVAAPLAHAQGAYPDKPVRFVVPYPPGGGTDVIARIVQGKFQTVLGQSINIENKGGAGGSLGTELVAKAAPDGYTVLFTLSSHTINPAIYPKLSYDTVKDFEPIGTVASLPQILVASLQTPINSVAELIAAAKANPGSMAYGSVGNGSPAHLAGEMLKLKANIQMTHVPYRGGGPAVIDVMGGQIPMTWVSIPAAAQFVKTGKLKALAVSTTKRAATLPDVPTMIEAGVPDFEVDSWFAMFVPAKTPKAVIDRLNKALNEVVADPTIRARLLEQGAEGVGGTPEALAKVVSLEIPRWIKLAKEAHIKGD